jgi:hypothetical protein
MKNTIGYIINSLFTNIFATDGSPDWGTSKCRIPFDLAQDFSYDPASRPKLPPPPAGRIKPSKR